MNFKIKEIKTNLSPFDIYNVFKNEEDSAFLDSSKEDVELSKYSFIGINKIEEIEGINGEVFINSKSIGKGDYFLELEKRIEHYKLDYKSEIPLLSGFIGYISYDAGRTLEKLPDTSTEDFDMPHMKFILYNNVIIFDLINNKTFITSIGYKENDIEEIENKISNAKKVKEVELTNKNIKFHSNFTKEEYIEALRKLKNYIKEGDIYITNMTQRFYCDSYDDPFFIYSKLRKINKAPFSAYLNYKDFQIISSSPERFIKIQDRMVMTRPIKGTRPRGKDSREDLFYRKELENSEKDKSELLMIVDLERNDLSKVCENNSVKVTELFKIEEYATVFHLVSEIVGKLKKENSAVKCIKEAFPGGSITGAPKIRSMEIIEELEGVKRNLYTGSIGYFDLRGNSDLNIVIRTIVKKDNKAYFGVGGGITFESNEEEEYYETIQKAKALMRVLR
ncbi:aminodeoxychorismate synthase component I [Clostridium baratii]|uniref:aminodeoxychorismate synthase component I n=1 Tax=Clostridium baratii TaxID=1561 RepID=UPI002906D8AA|nr:aminodeoxychorismate synthase component I [Clostridium baratii]MDU4912209.1 aminodeoxychorismate synthase component I [Clostridium baratii]